jgi:hypothetical protein
VILPGFTHLQVAQPVSFGHHMLAYVEMFARDAERLADVRRRVNRLPLGAPRWPAPATRWTASAWPDAGHGRRRHPAFARTAWTR